MEEKWKKDKTGIEKYTDKKCKITQPLVDRTMQRHKTSIKRICIACHVITNVQTLSFNSRFNHKTKKKKYHYVLKLLKS